jgi:hypothetical protein
MTLKDLWIPFGLFSAAAAFAVDPVERPKTPADAPPPEATEVWKPEPPVVSAPANGIPSDAIVLFNGKNLDAWLAEKGGPMPWKLDGDMMVMVPKTGYVRTKEGFGDIQLHIEFRTPAEVKGDGQGRGNSGVFFMGLYELQVLDSYNNPTYPNGQAGSIYKQHIPLVNASRGPGEWQSYDAVFIAPRFSADGLQDHGNPIAFRNIWVRELTLPETK